MAAMPRRPLVACTLVFLLLGQSVAVRPPAVGRKAESELGAAAEPDGGGQLVELKGATRQVALTAPGGAIVELTNRLARVADRKKGGVCGKIRALIQAIGTLAKEALYTWIDAGYHIVVFDQPWLAPSTYSGPFSENFFPIQAVGDGGGVGGGFNYWYEVKLAFAAGKTAYSTIKTVVEGTVATAASAASLAQFAPVVGLVLTAMNCVTSFCDLFGKMKLAWEAAVKKTGGDPAIKKRLVCEAVVDGARVLVGLMFTALGIAATVGSFGAAGLAIPVMNVAWDAASHYVGQMTCDWLARQANGGKREKDAPGGVLGEGLVSGVRTLGEIGEAVIDDDDVEGGEPDLC